MSKTSAPGATRKGRLVWGANDFDEASVIPYPFDLVRLATSARLAKGHSIGGKEICAAILRGYDDGLVHPRPTVLHEEHAWLRALVLCPDDKRAKFWRELDELEAAEPPSAVRAALICELPVGSDGLRFTTRTAGGGSLGRPRYVAIGDWRGARVVREAKALVPSAWDWAHNFGNAPPRFIDLAMASMRAPDPFMTVTAGFIIRRLAPDSQKAELGDNPGAELEEKLLKAMGREIGSLHAVTANVQAILTDLRKRDDDWLHAASKTAKQAVKRDFEEWAAI
jgi:hypothetical protein